MKSENKLQNYSTPDLVKIVENYFTVSVWRDFVYSCAERGEDFFDTALRTWAIDLLMEKVGIDTIIKDGF